MLNEWRIEKPKRHVFLRDEGSNMKKGFEQGGYLHADCSAHKLILVVNKSFFKNTGIKPMLESCSESVGHFSHSNLDKGRLKKEQKHLNKITAYCRWNGSLYMAQRLLKQRIAVEMYLVKHNKHYTTKGSRKELMLDEWSLLEKVVKVLESLEVVSKQMCREDEPISVQYPVARALTMVIHDIRDQSADGIYGLAIFLDSRFNNQISWEKVKFSAKVAAWVQEECELVEELVEEAKRTTLSFGQLSRLFTDEEGSNEEQASDAFIEMKA